MKKITLDFESLDSREIFYAYISQELSLPEWTGRNADALNDVLGEYPGELEIIIRNSDKAGDWAKPALTVISRYMKKHGNNCREGDRSTEISQENSGDGSVGSPEKNYKNMEICGIRSAAEIQGKGRKEMEGKNGKILTAENMLRSDFYYELPEELIAQTPAEPRNHSRLLKVNRVSGEVEHGHFYDLGSYLKKGDLLVMNDSRVLPARLFGVKDTGAAVEFLLLEQKGDKLWETLVRPGKKAKPGTKFTFGGGIMTGEIIDTAEGGNRIVKFGCEGNFFTALERVGQMPLPPYITKKLEDKERYQTVYSRELGSAAAPTAGLHFTEEMLEELRRAGVNTAFVTLHVGLGTFRPVKEDRVLDHKMHSEHFAIPEETAALINKTKAEGGRVIAVGTTSCRTLESAAQKYGEIKTCEGYTDIFIYPGFEFKVLDGLVTNFHLPESTLIMLVSAFMGYENTMNAYKKAVEERYRFFSFGDAMLII